MSVSLSVDDAGFDAILRRVRDFLEIDEAALMDALGAIGESQTRRRIAEEKTAPDGSAWPPNAAGTDILLETGQHLLGSIAFTSSPSEAVWGASWEYAFVHQDGMTIRGKTGRLRFRIGDRMVTVSEVTIPARPFIGISEDNARELLDIVTDVWGLA